MIDKRVRIVLRAGFGPASSARKAGILDRAIFGRASFGSSTGAFYAGASCKIHVHSNKSYPLKAVFKHSFNGANIVSALFSVGA